MMQKLKKKAKEYAASVPKIDLLSCKMDTRATRKETREKVQVLTTLREGVL